VVLAEQLVKAVNSLSQLFVGEKREREREEYGEAADIGGWRRKTHEWIFSEVSGTGARKDGRFSKYGSVAGGSGAMVRMGHGENRRFLKR
jgi:hypothetical protein